MRLFFIFILVLHAGLAFGQTRHWSKTVLIFLDGKRISYKDVETMDTSRFSTLTVRQSKLIGEVFGKRKKTHIVHLRSEQFIGSQERTIQELRSEFETDGHQTKSLKINGVNYKRNQAFDEKFLSLKSTDIEWILPGRNKTSKIIQTNVPFEMD